MKVKEIIATPRKERGLVDDTIDLLKRGWDTAMGNVEEVEYTGRTVLQYPAQRAAAKDAVSHVLTDLYKNGLLFTAYDYTKRASGELKSFRVSKKRVTGSIQSDAIKNTVTTILMPRSLSDVDQVSQKYADVKDNLALEAFKNGGAEGAISQVASQMVGSAIESVVGGFFANHAEQMYTATRATYQGADKRSKVFTWNLVPKNNDDLIAINLIAKVFKTLSYGKISNSKKLKEEVAAFKEAYAAALRGNRKSEEEVETLLGKAADFVTNLQTISNPTVWMVQNFYATTEEANIDNEDIFGPACITGIRFDKAPDGHFNGLAKYPNISGSYVLEVTMQEIIPLDRGSLGVQL